MSPSFLLSSLPSKPSGHPHPHPRTTPRDKRVSNSPSISRPAGLPCTLPLIFPWQPWFSPKRCPFVSLSMFANISPASFDFCVTPKPGFSSYDARWLIGRCRKFKHEHDEHWHRPHLCPQSWATGSRQTSTFLIVLATLSSSLPSPPLSQMWNVGPRIFFSSSSSLKGSSRLRVLLLHEGDDKFWPCLIGASRLRQ